MDSRRLRACSTCVSTAFSARSLNTVVEDSSVTNTIHRPSGERTPVERMVSRGEPKENKTGSAVAPSGRVRSLEEPQASAMATVTSVIVASSIVRRASFAAGTSCGFDSAIHRNLTRQVAGTLPASGGILDQALSYGTIERG